MADDDDNTTDGSDATSDPTSTPTAPTSPGAGSTAAVDDKTAIPAEVERALRKANKEAESLRLKLKAFEDRDKTEQQLLADKAETVQREVEKLRAEALRSKVALAKGLPATLAERLRGDDEDSLMADADALLSLVKPARPSGDVDQGARTNNGGGKGQWAEADLKGKSPEQIAKAFTDGLLDDVLANRP